ARAQVDTRFAAILLRGQNAAAAVVQLVDGAFAFGVGAIARRYDLGDQIEPIGIALAGLLGGVAVDDDDIRLWIVIFDRRRKIEPGGLIHAERWHLALERFIQKQLEIARD